MSNWLKLACNRHQLNLDIVLLAGQSFRWHETKPKEWTGVLRGRVYTLSQTESDILYRVFHKGFGTAKANDDKKTKFSIKPKTKKCNKLTSNDQGHNGENSAKCREPAISQAEDKVMRIPCDYNKCYDSQPVCDLSQGEHAISCQNMKEDCEILHDYFQLDVSSADLYNDWISKDSHFKGIAERYTGIRQLRQDPVENLFSFICSSNNNITRISSMVENMCKHYGDEIAVVNGQVYYDFPTIEALAAPGVEETLRTLGFGYRAKYITETARYIHAQHSTQWLYGLRNIPYEEARLELLKLCGVGPKVADCVCLMSLDKHHVVPIDTHVFQFALRDYSHHPAIAKHRGVKNLTDKVYKELGDFFRDLWGDYAGWAQSVLFSAELPKFQDPNKMKKRKLKRKSAAKDAKDQEKKKR